MSILTHSSQTPNHYKETLVLRCLTDFGFEEVYSMKMKADDYDCLNQFCTTYGIPKHIVMDNVAKENWGDWNTVQKLFPLKSEHH
jgi:hypothetical protein